MIQFKVRCRIHNSVVITFCDTCFMILTLPKKKITFCDTCFMNNI